MPPKLAIGLEPVQELALQCAVCTAIYRPSKLKADQIVAALFGYEPFAICINCGRKVPKKQWTAGYKARWQERVAFYYMQLKVRKAKS